MDSGVIQKITKDIYSPKKGKLTFTLKFLIVEKLNLTQNFEA